MNSELFGVFKNNAYDSALFVVLDEIYDLEEIWQADVKCVDNELTKKLARSKSKNPQKQLTLGQFKKLASSKQLFP